MKTKFICMLIMCAALSFSAGANSKNISISTTSLSVPPNPMIIKAYKEIYKRKPNIWELNAHNYNNGQWKTYPELKGYIQQFQKALKKQKLTIAIGITRNTGQSAIGFVQNNKLIAADIAADSNGDIIAEGGPKVTAQMGTLVIATDGRNYVMVPELPGFNFGTAGDMLKPGEKQFATSGKSALIIQKAPVIAKPKVKKIAKK